MDGAYVARVDSTQGRLIVFVEVINPVNVEHSLLLAAHIIEQILWRAKCHPLYCGALIITNRMLIWRIDCIVRWCRSLHQTHARGAWHKLFACYCFLAYDSFWLTSDWRGRCWRVFVILCSQKTLSTEKVNIDELHLFLLVFFTCNLLNGIFHALMHRGKFSVCFLKNIYTSL